MSSSARANVYKNIVIISLIMVVSYVILLLKWNISDYIQIKIIDNLILNAEFLYQIATIGLAFLFLIVSYILQPENVKRFFSIGKINAEIVPVKALGINPKPKENWLHLGTSFSIIISGVTLIIVYFQALHGKDFSFAFLSVLPWAILFAFTNSFVEEIIFRFSVVTTLFGSVKNEYIYLISGLLFGLVHYFGVPAGIPGVLMAGFLGWFLAKSIVETRGIFWAWLIHFLQDVIIFSFMFIDKLF